MPKTIHVKTTVLPGGKVEVDVPGAAAGQPVEVVVTVPDPVPADKPQMGVYDWLKSLPPSSKTAEEWEQFDREFKAERDSWDR